MRAEVNVLSFEHRNKQADNDAGYGLTSHREEYNKENCMKKLKLLFLLLTMITIGGCGTKNTNDQSTINIDISKNQTDVITDDSDKNIEGEPSELPAGTDTLYPAYLNNEGNQKYGYIDNTGNFIISPIYDQASDFSEGFAVVYDSENNEYSIINTEGSLIYKGSYNIGSFHEGLAIYDDYINGKTVEGYIDTTGTIVLPAIYEKASDFQDGKAYVYADNQIQQIDTMGNILVSYDIPEHDIYISDFRDGYILYNNVGNSIMEAMNYKGEKLPLPNNVSENYTGYSNLKYLGNNIFAVMQKSEIEDFSSSYTSPYALFTPTGIALTDYVFYDLSEFHDGYASATDDTSTYFLDASGNTAEDLPRFEGRGTLTLNDKVIKAEIDGDLSYETTDGTIFFKTSKDVKLNSQLTLEALKFKPNKFAVVDYPELTGLDDGSTQKKINEQLYKLFVEKRKELTKEDNLSVEDSFNGKIINNILLVEQLGYDYPFGAAHGMPITNYYPIDLKTGQIYALKDLFNENSNYVEVLNKIIAADIKDDSKDDQSIYFEDAFSTIAEDQYFHVDKDNLYIYFYPYDIAPYAAGFPEFKIPFESINEIINKDGDFYKALETVQ